MIKEIILPELGEGIDGAEVSEVSVTVGDVVAVDETIMVLESDKASMEIPAAITSPISGPLPKRRISGWFADLNLYSPLTISSSMPFAMGG